MQWSASLAVLLLAACTVPGDLRYIGGTVSGLDGGGLVLQLNGGDDLPVPAHATAFRLEALVAEGKPYAVSVATQPSSPSQTCTVAQGSGTAGSANVTDVQVTCIVNAYAVGGEVHGLAGSGLVLQLSGASDLPVGADAATFQFPDKHDSGQGYVVTVRTQPTNPSQTCAVTNGTGALTSADVADVSVSCTTNRYAIRGAVTGLKGSGLTLQLNGANDLPLAATATNFAFPGTTTSGADYNVTVLTPPGAPTQKCIVANGSGTVGGTDVSDIAVTCGTVNFLYALDSPLNANQSVRIYGIDPFTGAVTLLGSPLPLPSASGADGIVVDAGGRFAFIVNFGTQDISSYLINSATGGLTAVGNYSVLPNGFPDPIFIAMDPGGRFVYTANSETGNVSGLRIDTVTGSLSRTPGSPYRVADIGEPLVVVVDPTGQFLYELGTFTDPFPPVSVYTIDLTSGMLTGVADFNMGVNPKFVAFDPTGQFVYAANSNSISAFSVNATNGAPQALSGSPIVAGANPVAMVIDPAGTYLYAVNAGSNNMTVCRRLANGTLRQLEASPFPVGPNPHSIQMDASGKYLYVANADSISVYRAIDSDAAMALSQVPGSPFDPGTSPRTIAITSKR